MKKAVVRKKAAKKAVRKAAAKKAVRKAAVKKAVRKKCREEGGRRRHAGHSGTDDLSDRQEQKVPITVMQLSPRSPGGGRVFLWRRRKVGQCH